MSRTLFCHPRTPTAARLMHNVIIVVGRQER